MKPFEQDKVKQLLKELQTKPAQCIAHFTTSSHMLTKYIHQFCQTHDIDYHLYSTKEVFYDKSVTKYADQSNIHIEKLDLRHHKYRMQNMKFDHLIVTLDHIEEDKGAFLTKCSPLIRKNGNIIIIIPKIEDMEGQVWKKLLQVQHYVSINDMKDHFEYYDVISAKNREIREK